MYRLNFVNKNLTNIRTHTMSLDFKTIIICLVVIVILFCIVTLLARNFIFEPFATNIILSKSVTSNYAFKNDQIELVSIETQDKKGTIWISYLINPQSNFVILYSHGSMNHMGYNEKLFEQFKPFCSIVMYDYRGYGKSTGVSSEETIQDDIYTAYDFTKSQLGFAPENIVLYGKSLGVYPSIYLANKLESQNIVLKYIILESGFASSHDLFEQILNKTIVKILLKNKFKSYDLISGVKRTPILISHSHEDELIKNNHQQKLLENGSNNVTSYNIQNQHHVSISLNKDYMKIILNCIYNA